MAVEERHNRPFVEVLEEYDQAEKCRLFSPGPDFTTACSCDECLPKIAKLRAFEDNMKSKRNIVFGYLSKLDDDETLCVNLFSGVQWTIFIFDSLFRKLQSLSENSGVPVPLIEDPSAIKVRNVFLKVHQMLKDNGLSDTTTDDEVVHQNYLISIPFEIQTGIYYYGLSKAKNKAYDILNDIARLECEHEQKMEANKEEGKSLDPSISKHCVEHQFELVKQLPIEDLSREIEELILMICPLVETKGILGEARKFNTKSALAMIRERKDFWHRFQEHHSSIDASKKGCEAHDLNGLSETLDSLLAMADKYTCEWERLYHPFFSRFDRSNPKRLRKS